VRRSYSPTCPTHLAPEGAPTELDVSAQDGLHSERQCECAGKEPEHLRYRGSPLAAFASRLEVGHEEQTPSVCWELRIRCCHHDVCMTDGVEETRPVGVESFRGLSG
jgi:hypothetical protein